MLEAVGDLFLTVRFSLSTSRFFFSTRRDFRRRRQKILQLAIFFRNVEKNFST